MKANIGVVEGFFGPSWGDARKSYADFLASQGAGFYIYAPKKDAHLRKAWREKWDSNYIQELSSLVELFHQKNVDFGVGFSPFGLGKVFTKEDQGLLREKVQIFSSLGVRNLGLFFDDMMAEENLAESQMAALEIVQHAFSNKIIFCPTFYSYDPILEKVFGAMPMGYFSFLRNIPQNIEIAWTGPKVISPDLEATHLQEVTTLLGRKPFLWDNLFANDGPKRCKNLILTPYSGRSAATMEYSSSIGLNMMNQPELSKVVFASAKKTLQGTSALDAWRAAVTDLCSPQFADFLLTNGETFSVKSLDTISEEQKQAYLASLHDMKDLAAQEVIAWLKGDYIVGSECLTD